MQSRKGYVPREHIVQVYAVLFVVLKAYITFYQLESYYTVETYKSVSHLFVGDAELRGDQRVRNKLLYLLEEMKVGWTPDVVDTIEERFLKRLTNTLWYLDSHHQKFSSISTKGV